MDNQQEPTISDEDRFGIRLRQERTRLGLTQAQVAEKLAQEENVHLHPSAIAKMETRGVDRPRTITLNEASAIARVLGVPLDQMFGEVSDKLSGLHNRLSRFGSAVDQLDDVTRDLDQAFGQAVSVLRRTERSAEVDKVLADLEFSISYNYKKLRSLGSSLGSWSWQRFDEAAATYFAGDEYGFPPEDPKDLSLLQAERDSARRDVQQRYESGEGIRSIAQNTGYSFLSVIKLLLESGTRIEKVQPRHHEPRDDIAPDGDG